jgi:hypothetical protein
MQDPGECGQRHAEHGAVHTDRQHSQGQGAECPPPSIHGRRDGYRRVVECERHGVARPAEEASSLHGATDRMWSSCPNQASLGSICQARATEVRGNAPEGADCLGQSPTRLRDYPSCPNRLVPGQTTARLCAVRALMELTGTRRCSVFASQLKLVLFVYGGRSAVPMGPGIAGQIRVATRLETRAVWRWLG